MACGMTATLGYAAIDYLLKIRQYPEAGTKCIIESRNCLCGGQAATAAVALARWGCTTRYIGRVGDDEPAEIIKNNFLSAGVIIDESLIKTTDTPTQSANIYIESATGERTIFWFRNPALNLRASDVQLSWLDDCRVLLIDGHEIEADIVAARHVKSAGGVVVLDAEFLGPRKTELLPLIDICFASSDFGKNDLGLDEPQSVISCLRSNGVGFSGVTLGKDGALADWGMGIHHFPALDIKAVDTTGAGDVFHAALVLGVLLNIPPHVTVEFANFAAGSSTLSIGAQSGIPDRDTVRRFLQERL